MSMSTTELQRTADQLQPRIQGIQSELDRVEQQVRFQMQTSGYPTTSSQDVQRQAEVERELHLLKEKANTFGREVSDKIESITRYQSQSSQPNQFSSPQGGGSQTPTQWATSLIQAVRETLDVTQQWATAVSRAGASGSGGSSKQG